MGGDIFMIIGVSIGIVSTIAFVSILIWLIPRAREIKHLLDSLYKESE
jgi:preprotein translocase subunit SecF